MKTSKALKLAALRADYNALLKAMESVKYDMGCFDMGRYYDEDMFIKDMREESEKVDIFGHKYHKIDILREMDNKAFRECYNNRLEKLGKMYFDEYKALQGELEELENTLFEVDYEIVQLENE